MVVLTEQIEIPASYEKLKASFGLLVLLVNITKTGLIPQEDTGTVMVSIDRKSTRLNSSHL